LVFGDLQIFADVSFFRLSHCIMRHTQLLQVSS